MSDPFRTLVATLAAAPTQTYPVAAELMGALVNMAQMETGAFAGTGSAISVATNGDPRLVILVNITQHSLAVHISGMADASMLLCEDTPDVEYISTAGITLGTNSFTIGTNADVNTASDEGFWVAFI